MSVMTKTQPVKNSKSDAMMIFLFALVFALVALALVALLVGGVFMMESAGQDAGQAWTGLAMIAGSIFGSMILSAALR